MGIAALVTTDTRDLAGATFPVIAVAKVTLVCKFEIPLGFRPMHIRSRPARVVGVSLVAFGAWFAAESALQVRAVTGCGAIRLAIFNDIVAMGGQGYARFGMGKLLMAAPATGGAATDRVRYPVAPQAGHGVQVEDVFDIHAVYGRVFPF